MTNEMNRKFRSLLAHEGMTFEEAKAVAEALQIFWKQPEENV